MKIEACETKVTVNFAFLKEGGAFWHGSGLWIKTKTIYNKLRSPLHNAVRLRDGYFAYFSDSATNWTKAKVKIVNEEV